VLERENDAWEDDQSSLGTGFGQLENFCTSWVSPSQLAVVGGRGPNGLERQTRIYNFRTQVWQELTNLPEGNAGHACVATKNMLLVAGGFSSSSSCARCVCDPSESSRQTWALPLSSSSRLAKWSRLPDMLHPRNNFHLVHLRSRLLAVGSGTGIVEEWKEKGEKWAKVKELSLPWDIKVTPVSISTADMEVSRDTIGTGSLDHTEIELEVDMDITTDMPETAVQTSMGTVSKSVIETTVDISETKTQESLETETTRQGGVEVTSKTSMDGRDKIDVDRVKEETTPVSSMESSSLSNIEAGLGAVEEIGEDTEGEKVLETSMPRTMKVSLEAITEIVEHREEGNHHHHQMDVNTKPPQSIPRRTIYQYLLHHHDHHRTKINSIFNMTH